jgi:glycerol-3-phosphate dehydrogenase
VTPAGAADSQALRVRPSKGVHIVVPRERIAMDTGLLARTEKSVLFVIPWGQHWVIGDTDTEWPFDPGLPAASRGDIDYLLAKVNAMLREPLTADDIEGVFAGLRPLVAAGESKDTTKLSREHSIRSPMPGLSVIAGGKYTTYRVMARDLVDAAARDLSSSADWPGDPVRASRTDQVPLAGANGYAQMWATREALAERAGLTVAQFERLLGRYGADVALLTEAIEARPDLAAPLPGSGGYLGAEVAFACTHEGALRLDDVLSRRTRIAIETRDRGAAAAPHAAALMAAELNWDEARTAAEVAAYLELIAAELEAETMPDDLSAYQVLARTSAPRRSSAVGADERPRSRPVERA